MSKPYKTCPNCGDHLDPGEICDCQAKGAGQQAAEPPRRARTHRSASFRVEICRECGLDWNVSKKAVIPPEGYLCPRCWSKQRDAGSMNASKKRSNK